MELEKKQDEPEIPTSSMADIAFLLIIFFMMTSVFASTRGLDYLLPQKKDIPDQIEPEEAVHIKIMPDKAIIVDGNQMGLQDILTYLGPKLERNPNKPILIQTEPEAPYHVMVDVYDQLKLASQPPEKGGIGLEIKNISIPTLQEIRELEQVLGTDL